jgi:septum site-determining protein MinD
MMGKVYAIVSGKGGTGKTTTTINRGAALTKFKSEVIIVDANLTTPNLSLYLGAPVVTTSLSHVLQKKAKIEDAIYEHHSGMKVVPSSLSLKDLKKINYGLLADTLKSLRKLSNHIILDSAAGLGEEAIAPISASDEVIVVVNPNILSVTDALKTIKIAHDLKKRVKGAIITRANYDDSEMSTKSIQEMLEVPILGIIPEDKAIHKSLSKRNCVIHSHPRSKSSKSYMDIAAKMMGKKRKRGFYEDFLKRLGFK